MQKRASAEPRWCLENGVIWLKSLDTNSDSLCAYFPIFALDGTRGDSVCSGCGQVLLQRPVDEAHDWRNFADSDQDNARASVTDPYAGGSLTTRVSAGNSKMSQKMAWEHNKYNMDTKTKNLQTARDVIAGFTQTLNLAPQIQSKALELYRQYEEKRVSSQRKATHRPLMVAIIYIACKQEGFGRTFKELAKSTSESEKEIRNFYKSLDKLLPNNSSPLDSSSLVERFCARLNDPLPEWVKIGAGNIARNATGILEGRQPATIAAASILLACSAAGIPMDHDTVAAATQTISGSTVQGAFSVLLQNKAKAIPPEYLNKISQKRTDGPAKPSSAPISSATSSAPSTATFKAPISAPAPLTSYAVPTATLSSSPAIKADPSPLNGAGALNSGLVSKPPALASVAPSPLVVKSETV